MLSRYLVGFLLLALGALQFEAGAYAQDVKHFDVALRVNAGQQQLLEHRSTAKLGSPVRAMKVPSRAKFISGVADDEGVRLDYTVREITVNGTQAVAVLDLKVYTVPTTKPANGYLNQKAP
jgi:hypothetical protein